MKGASVVALPRRLRCAIYTRKSSEEGLDMEFNSLDAQREACEAYVASQKAKGWAAIRERYDDGGFSGGTLERPALRHLLADIEAGLVDVVVVYKIDRLSRSLMDFAKLVEVLDRNNVTFVSVTQSLRFLAKCHEVGATCELTLRKGAGHGGWAEMPDDVNRMAEWFDLQLLGKQPARAFNFDQSTLPSTPAAKKPATKK